MKIRPLQTEDLPAVAAIQQASPQAAHWPVDHYLGAISLVALTDLGSAHPDVIGFAVARQTIPEEAEILNVAVHPDWRRRGVARALLSALLDKLQGEVFLEVRASNLTAIHLYQTLGFLPVGRRESYYSYPREDAIVLRFQAC
jgi:ribosomal-protein-alanine N-acetyltransferase